LIKSYLNIDENNDMDGNGFEDYARKIFKIMCILGTKKDIFFESPEKILYSKIIKNSFIFSFSIKTPIKMFYIIISKIRMNLILFII